ncbi:MAG: hypothetical protein PHY42_06865 [Bacilli bacterium]|nr:hypothetical protein [Bacilli bacterium]
MKKAIKFVLVLVMVGLMTFAPVMKQGPGTPPGPGPDERPIGYICTTSSYSSYVRPGTKTVK